MSLRTLPDAPGTRLVPVRPDGAVAADERSLAEVVLDRVAPAEPTVRPAPVLTLVVPMFREQERIGATVATLAASPLADGSVTFLFVDDGSPDATADAAEAAILATGLPAARVLRLARNRGKGGVDAVVGRRVVDRAEQPLLRGIASVVFRRFTAAVAPTGVRDTQCAMKLFRTAPARALFSSLTTEGFAFDVEVLLRARRAGCVVDEVPVAWTHQPGSSVDPLAEALRMGRAVLGLRSAVRRVPTPSIVSTPSIAPAGALSAR